MNAYISDDDLLNLASLELYENFRIPALAKVEISWEATKQPPVVVVLQQQQPAPLSQRGTKKRKSSLLKRRRLVREMSVISEGSE